MSEEKKISLEEFEELLDEHEGKSRIDFQSLFTILVLNWQWFLLSLIIFVGSALVYLQYKEPVYRMSARMLIKGEDKGTNANQMLSKMENLGFVTNSTGIENEVEILQSRILIRDVVKDLNLYTEYRSLEGLKKPILYGTQPLNVGLDPAHLDSLDRILLDSVKSLRIEITRVGGYYVAEGIILKDDEETDTFRHQIKTLPSTINTSFGTLTFTRNMRRRRNNLEAFQVTIAPPMLVAADYLKALTVEPTSMQTSIALLTLDDRNIRRGMDFLRQLAVCFNRQANADKNEIALKTEEFINTRISKINTELGATEGAIEDFKRRNAVTDVGIDANSSVQMSSQFSAQLSEATAKLEILDYLRAYVNNMNDNYQVIPSNVGMDDPTAKELISNYNQSVQDRNRLLKAASEQAPQVQTLTATIKEQLASIQAALLQARRSADISRQGIQSQYAKFQGKVSTAPVAERVLNQIGRQQDVKSDLYLMLLKKREENTISLAATADKGRLIDEPLLEKKVSPMSLIILLSALILGILMPAVLIWIRSFFRYKIEGHEDIVGLTSLPIIADVAIASDAVKGKAGVVVQENSNNQMDEIFRSMRTNIQFMLKNDEKVILFTSSTSGEGKTFNASNLAVSFALLGKKVILCGLDIRKPALGRLFGIQDRKEGITSLLSAGEVTTDSLNSRIKPSGVNACLDLLLAGPVPPNPTELLARDSFRQIVTLLRSQYDYIIFDTAPVGLVTDTIQIGQFADITVFVCRADYTPKSSINTLNLLAKEHKMPTPCIVLNGIDMSKRKYGYYYGYGRYGKYGRYGYGRRGYGSYGGQHYGQYYESHYGTSEDESVKR